MLKKSAWIVLVLLFGSLAACSSAAKTPAAVTSSELVNIVWQWSDMSETQPASQSVVPDPQNYTITFNTDGTVAIKADCNNVSGTYKLDGSSLTITLGASTMAFCGEASQDSIYLASLSKVNAAAMENNRLILLFANDAGRMGFNNGGAAS